jgi:hypothetical protein
MLVSAILPEVFRQIRRQELVYLVAQIVVVGLLSALNGKVDETWTTFLQGL